MGLVQGKRTEITNYKMKNYGFFVNFGGSEVDNFMWIILCLVGQCEGVTAYFTQ